ncbi:MAG: hypothetical protein ACK56I_21260 [bacterium]
MCAWRQCSGRMAFTGRPDRGLPSGDGLDHRGHLRVRPVAGPGGRPPGRGQVAADLHQPRGDLLAAGLVDL